MEINKLIEKAKMARENAYVPYSNFKVGAVLETESGKIFTGANVENSSFGLSMCAERIAIFKAVSEGETKFKRMIIIADTKDVVSPCGACRQVMSEFGNFEVILSNMKGKMKVTDVESLLPMAFNLKKDRE